MAVWLGLGTQTIWLGLGKKSHFGLKQVCYICRLNYVSKSCDFTKVKINPHWLLVSYRTRTVVSWVMVLGFNNNYNSMTTRGQDLTINVNMGLNKLLAQTTDEKHCHWTSAWKHLCFFQNVSGKTNNLCINVITRRRYVDSSLSVMEVSRMEDGLREQWSCLHTHTHLVHSSGIFKKNPSLTVTHYRLIEDLVIMNAHTY